MCCLQPPLGPPLVLPETLLWVPGALPNLQSYSETCSCPQVSLPTPDGNPSVQHCPAFLLCRLPGVSARLPSAPSSQALGTYPPASYRLQHLSLFEKPFPFPHGCLPLPLLLQGQSASKSLLLSDPLSALSSLQCVSGQSHSHHNAKSKDWASPVPHSTCLLVLTAPPPSLTSPPSTPTSLSCLPNHRLLCLCPSFKL